MSEHWTGIPIFYITKKECRNIRLKIAIENSKQLRIPYNYQYQLGSLILRSVKSELEEPRGMRPYSFSKIICEKPFNTNNKGIVFQHGHIYFTTPSDNIAEKLEEELLNSSQFHIGHKEGFRIYEIERVEEKVEKQMTFKTLSPIYLKTKRIRDGELKEWDLLPTEGKC